MRTSSISCAVAAALLTSSMLAQAQTADPQCPPGSWFCEDTPASEPPPDLPPPTLTPPPRPPKEGQAPTTIIVPGAQPTPPVVVYQQAPPPPAVVVVRRPVVRYVAPPPPPPKTRLRLRKWGFNMHLSGVLMDDQEDESAGMGGLGFAFRIRPERHLAVDFGLDMVGGRDYQGRQRSEVPFTITGMLYANPRDAAQFYMLGGIGWSHARVETDDRYGDIEDYDYFGGHLGAGMEFRLSAPIALNIDLLGFIRGRTDRLAEREPEFTDPETGQTTNTSGGGLLRAGLTFYW